MRILHLLASPAWTGPADNMATLALTQRELGHEVSVAIDRRRATTTSEEPSYARIGALGLLDDGGLELSVKSPPWRVLRDIRRLSRRRVDVVHAHFSHDHFIAAHGCPRGARLVRSIHAPRSIRWSLPRADAYTVPTAADARRLLGRRVGVLPALVGTSFRPGDRRGLRDAFGIHGGPIVGMVSTFQPSRRHDVGVEAFRVLHARCPTARLVLVGDGELQEAVSARVKAAGLERVVTFAGYQSGDAFVPWLQILDVVWVLGLGNDWSGRAAAQAQACDVRVVAVDEGALRTWADVIVTLDPSEIAAASLEVEPADRVHWSNEEIARAVLRLYSGDDRGSTGGALPPDPGASAADA